MHYEDNEPGGGEVSECLTCGTMILPEDQGIIPMLCTSAKIAGPSFFLAHFCCEKCLQKFIDQYTGGKINVLPCIVFPEDVDITQFGNLIKLELRSVDDADDTDVRTDDCLWDYDEDEVRDHNDFMIDDEYYDSYNDYDYDDDDEEDDDYGGAP